MNPDVMSEKIKKHDAELDEIKKDIEIMQIENKEQNIKQAEIIIMVANLCSDMKELTAAMKWFTVAILTGMGSIIIWGIQFITGG